MFAENGKTVLVVEDNPINMKLAVDLLEINGYKTFKAEDGESALKMLENEKVDLVLLDIQLPGIDGFEVLKRIRQLPCCKDSKVVALTAQAMKEEVERIKQSGFNDYILKPINIKGFVAKVKEFLV